MVLLTCLLVQGAENYWPLDVGREWAYASTSKAGALTLRWAVTGTRKVKGAEGVVFSMEVPDASSKPALKRTEVFVLRLEKEGVKFLDWDGAGPGDLGYLLKIPLKKGLKWENRLLAGPEMEVSEGAEDVKVPAGTFTCRKITFVNGYPGGRKVSTTWWLADGTGLVKSEELSEGGGAEPSKKVVELKELKKPEGK